MPYARKGMDVLGIFSQISRISQMQLEEVSHRFHRFHRCCAGKFLTDSTDFTDAAQGSFSQISRIPQMLRGRIGIWVTSETHYQKHRAASVESVKSVRNTLAQPSVQYVVLSKKSRTASACIRVGCVQCPLIAPRQHRNRGAIAPRTQGDCGVMATRLRRDVRTKKRWNEKHLAQNEKQECRLLTNFAPKPKTKNNEQTDAPPTPARAAPAYGRPLAAGPGAASH